MSCLSSGVIDKHSTRAAARHGTFRNLHPSRGSSSHGLELSPLFVVMLRSSVKTILINSKELFFFYNPSDFSRSYQACVSRALLIYRLKNNCSSVYCLTPTNESPCLFFTVIDDENLMKRMIAVTRSTSLMLNVSMWSQCHSMYDTNETILSCKATSKVFVYSGFASSTFGNLDSEASMGVPKPDAWSEVGVDRPNASGIFSERLIAIKDLGNLTLME